MNTTQALETKLRAYYITAVSGVLFALIGFSYNAWRLEVSEDNNNIRTAAFAVLTELAELEQLIYLAHYDHSNASPRTGWVKAGLIVDPSGLISEPVQQQATALRQSWTQRWQRFPADRTATDELVAAIDAVRVEIKL
ncbi:MAG: hypothetical protein JKY89_02340, partial [Immundisolibacteraceae bacterium]|nr:hypothetical protein [Immundisolibacteraceae bacterium]